MVDHIEKSTSSDSKHRTTSSAISFSDPEETAVKEFELHESQNVREIVADQQKLRKLWLCDSMEALLGQAS